MKKFAKRTESEANQLAETLRKQYPGRLVTVDQGRIPDQDGYGMQPGYIVCLC